MWPGEIPATSLCAAYTFARGMGDEYVRGFVRHWCLLLGIDAASVTIHATPLPGGDPDNSAHVHAEDDLADFYLEYDPDQTREAIRLGVVHELLHVAFCHVGAIVGKIGPAESAWLNQALEEDTERLARALVNIEVFPFALAGSRDALLKTTP